VLGDALGELVPDLQGEVAEGEQLAGERGDCAVGRVWGELDAVVPALLAEERELDDHAFGVGVGEDALEAVDVFDAEAAIGEVERALGAGIDEAAAVVPLGPDAEDVDAVALELAEPCLAVVGGLEGGVVDGVEEADAGVRERLAIELEAGAGDRELVGGGDGREGEQEQAFHDWVLGLMKSIRTPAT
jgi:hypothetical protein